MQALNERGFNFTVCSTVVLRMMCLYDCRDHYRLVSHGISSTNTARISPERLLS